MFTVAIACYCAFEGHWLLALAIILFLADDE